MKKIYLILAAAFVCLCVVACDGGEPAVTTDPSETTNIMPDTVATQPITDAPVTTEAADTTNAPDTTEPVTEAPVTDAPVTEPHVAGKELGSGFVISDSGTKLNLLINWTATNSTEEGYADITVKVFLECYSIFVGDRNDGEIKIGEELINYSTPQLEIGGTGFNEIDFGTYSFKVKKSDGASTAIPLYASWHFRGTYAGLSVDWVTLNGTVSFDN